METELIQSPHDESCTADREDTAVSARTREDTAVWRLHSSSPLMMKAVQRIVRTQLSVPVPWVSERLEVKRQMSQCSISVLDQRSSPSFPRLQARHPAPLPSSLPTSLSHDPLLPHTLYTSSHQVGKMTSPHKAGCWRFITTTNATVFPLVCLSVCLSVCLLKF